MTAPAPERRRGLLARLRDLDRAPGDPPALSGLDDLDPDMAELLAARDRSSAVLSAAPTDTTKETDR